LTATHLCPNALLPPAPCPQTAALLLPSLLLRTLGFIFISLQFPLLCSALSLRSAACPETALTPWLLAYSPVCWACTWFDWASLPPSPASRRISHHARLIPYTLPLLRPGHTRSLLTRALEPRLPAASFVLCYLPTSPFVAPNCLPSFAVSGRALLS
jgi:hypothetical protein